MTERVRVDRICEITGMSKRQVQALAANGSIPSAAQIGKLWTFREPAVRHWLKVKEKRSWRGISTGAAKRTGVVFKLPGQNIEEAYIRAIGLKRSRGSKNGGRKSAAPSSTAPNA